MKKFILTLFVATYATAAFSQWASSTYGYTLNPSSVNAGIGNSALYDAKLYLYQADNVTTGTLYGLNLTTSINNANSTGGLYGAYISTTKSNTNSAGAVSGVYSTVSSSSNSGNVYGIFSAAYNHNSANASAIYGNYIYSYNSNANAPVYGLYSSVGGGSAANRYSGYFTGGKFVVMNGNVGIETTTPQATLDIASSSANSVRIGKVGYTGNLNVPVNAVAAQFNIDFTGYRDINTDQVGARIAAIRLNNHQPNNALIQKTGLAFYTNPTGLNVGTTDLYERMRIAPDGNVGIGTTNPTEKLDVIGKIRAEEVKVCLNQGCDFVFDKDYKLMPLQDLSTFITENKHLPEVAPATVMESEGINLSEMNAKLLQKVEELTLYIIDLQKQIDELKK